MRLPGLLCSPQTEAGKPHGTRPVLRRKTSPVTLHRPLQLPVRDLVPRLVGLARFAQWISITGKTLVYVIHILLKSFSNYAIDSGVETETFYRALTLTSRRRIPALSPSKRQ